MFSARALLLAVCGILLPVGLGLAVYISSAGAVDARPPSLPSSMTVGRPATTAATETAPATTTDDHGGRCSEPEHRSDPECASGGGDDDNSGSGSSNSGSGSDSSGSGSDHDDD